MFDLLELDQAEHALRALASGDLPLPAYAPAPAPVEHARGDIARCPFHNGTLRRDEEIAA